MVHKPNGIDLGIGDCLKRKMAKVVVESGLGDSALRAAKRAWRALAPPSLRGLAQPVVTAASEQRVKAALAKPEPDLRSGPLIVSGLTSETKGISEAARLTLAGLQRTGLTPVPHDLRPLFEAGPGAGHAFPTGQSGGVWIAHLNAPDAMHALAYLDPSAWRGRYRIGYWAYELPRLPASWVKAADAFHEIWAPSTFVADAMRASGILKPIQVMPHPVALSVDDVASDRASFKIPSSEFVVLAMGDLRSSAERKNLLGAIEIFARAFPSPNTGARLLLKIQSEDAHPRFRARAEQLINGRSDIVLMGGSLARIDVKRLIASCDVYLSPHRSEGFGLPLAEAFLLGVPALATGWSGNLDFMKDLPELQIDYKLVPVKDPYGVYKQRDLNWAEPDVSDAAAKLSALAASADRRRNLAQRGKVAVTAQLSAWSRDRLEATALGRLVG